MSEDDKFITIRILRSLVEDVEEFLETSKGKRYTNRADFVSGAIREMLAKYETDKIKNPKS